MSRSTLFTMLFGVIGVVYLVHIAFFKVFDTDVWWHIRAGQVMWETGGLIRTDPFAWTRTGLPYLATHEWLAQLTFAATYSLGGSNAIIIVRILCVLAISGILLSIDRKNVWPNILLVMAIMTTMRQGILERPQLFTNILFAASMLIAFRLLDRRSTRQHEFFLWGGLLALQVLWVNLHGAAAILNFILIVAVFLQELISTPRSPRLRTIVIVGVMLVIAMFISPNMHHNITYVWSLLTDHTADTIREWTPRPLPHYLLQIGPFWIIALASLFWSRKHPIAIATILATTGALSRTGMRHEAVFLIAAVGCTFHELAGNARWQELLTYAQKKAPVGIGLSVLTIGGLLMANAPYRAYLAENNLLGFGTHSPAEGAVAFLEREKITGKIFNTYGIGGFLLFHHYPVFLDGRNVDYGYAYLERALRARTDVSVFVALVREYDFSILILDLETTRDSSRPPDFAFLAQDAMWNKVYTDDTAAVYLRNTPEHHAIIEKYGQ